MLLVEDRIASGAVEHGSAPARATALSGEFSKLWLRLRLYRNDARRGFTDIAAADGLTGVEHSDATFGDRNGDGAPDLVGLGRVEFVVLNGAEDKAGPIQRIQLVHR